MSIRIQPHGNAVVVTAERRLVVGNRQALKNAVVHELETLPVEFVMRGYLTGSTKTSI